jgi:hypothetical protein
MIMAAPSTVNAAGFFSSTTGGVASGEAVLRMETATKGSLSMSARVWTLKGDAAAKKLQGLATGSTVNLKIVKRSLLQGTVDGASLELVREVLRPIPPAEMAQFDAGPTGAMKTFLESVPDYQGAVGDTSTFWYAFGPVLYRGRLDGSARVLGIASDPGPTECLPFVRRTLVGDSGQKTQGFLRKLGFNRSYVLVNAFAVALHPSKASKGQQLLQDNAVLKAWRHGFYDRLLAGGALQAIVAFGDNAQRAYDIWKASNPAVAAVPVFKVAHPAAVDRSGSGNDAALKGWVKAITTLRGVVTPDPGVDPGAPNFGSYFTEADYVRVPRWDLPKVAPAYVGDDSWGRASTPRHNNCCDRPSPDDKVSLVLSPPPGQGIVLKYRYKDGSLLKATKLNGQVVPTDPNGIPT